MKALSNLPSLYVPVPVPSSDDVALAAARLAEDGAEEGTLIWTPGIEDAECAVEQSPALRWCLILRPDFKRVCADQLIYVTAVSVALAIAELAPPMTELRYGWPDTVHVNGLPAVRIRLSLAPGGDPPKWQLLDVEVQEGILPAAAGDVPLAAHAVTVAGMPTGALVEAFGRHFLSWLNRWADDGLAPVLRAWRLRVEGLNEPLVLQLPGGAVHGIATAIDDEGRLVLDIGEGHRRHVSVGEYLAGIDMRTAREP